MKNKFCKSLICTLLALIFVAGSVPAFAKNNTAGDINKVTDGILSFKQGESGAKNAQELLNGSLSSSITSGSEWYVMGLVRSGEKYDYSAYEKALSYYVTNNNVASAVTRQKYALALISVGCTDEKSKSFVLSCVDNSIGQQGVMSWIFALHLMNNGCKSAQYSVSDVINKILSLKNEDGGWSVSKGASDVDVTAMALQALSKYYRSDNNVQSAADAALTLLSQRQSGDGDFSSYGIANAESTAQVIIALTSLNIDVFSDSRFIKNNNTAFDGLLRYRLTDGSFSHKYGDKYNQMATAQAFCACVSLSLFQSGKGAFYLMPKAFAPESAVTESKATASSPENITSVAENTTASAATSSTEPVSVQEENQTAENNITEATPQKKTSYKLWACLTIVIVSVILSLVLIILKKKNYRNFVVISVVAAVLILFVCITNFQSADNYYNGEAVTKQNAVGTVTLTIRCDTILGKENAPENAEILTVTEFQIEQGETVYDVLSDASRQFAFPFEHDGNSYIKGINNLYEFDFGLLSGWIYRVNGETKSVGCAECRLSDGDKIEWLYTCDSGNDIKE